MFFKNTGTDVEVLMMKWTLGFCFLGVTVIFIIKMGALGITALQKEFAEMLNGQWVWEAIKRGMK